MFVWHFQLLSMSTCASMCLPVHLWSTVYLSGIFSYCPCLPVSVCAWLSICKVQYVWHFQLLSIPTCVSMCLPVHLWSTVYLSGIFRYCPFLPVSVCACLSICEVQNVCLAFSATVSVCACLSICEVQQSLCVLQDPLIEHCKTVMKGCIT